MTMPVMIGSRAALHGGFLPPWREGKVRDTDVLCSREWLADYCRHHQLVVPDGSRGMLDGAPGGLNWSIDSALHAQIANLCGDVIEVDWSPTPILVAPREVIWATRVHTVGYNPRTRDTALRDAAWYDALPLTLTIEHYLLAREVCRYSIQHLTGQQGAF